LEGGTLDERPPAWLDEAHRVYMIARVVPGWTREETDAAPAMLLDALIDVDGAYARAAERKRKRMTAEF
jgi:hypothetical protein